MSNVFEYLFPCDANVGDVIIKQGDEGDNFYIIDQVIYEKINDISDRKDIHQDVGRC